jgi:hypothetical protein
MIDHQLNQNTFFPLLAFLIRHADPLLLQIVQKLCFENWIWAHLMIRHIISSLPQAHVRVADQVVS